MKQYQSIPRWTEDLYGTRIIAFDKLDGSNIRAEWNPKKGFYKFGSRHHLIDENHASFGAAVMLIKEFSEGYASVARSERWESAVFFFEFYGPESFAGSHGSLNGMSVTMIDVNVYKRGHISAREMLDLFGEDALPDVLYMGEFDENLVKAVRTSSLPGMTFEGIVCRTPNDPDIIFKVKSEDWLSKLRRECGKDEELFKKLA